MDNFRIGRKFWDELKVEHIFKKRLGGLTLIWDLRNEKTSGDSRGLPL